MGHRLLPRAPALYHGRKSSRPYFEGWFFKHSSKAGSLAVIPGVFRGVSGKDDTAFIQVLLSNPVQSFFVRYPFRSFHSDKKRFDIQIGESSFSLEGAAVCINEIELEARLAYSKIVTLETSVLSPSIMGPFSYLPGMQCNHGVLSLRHEVNGYACCGDRRMDFDNADGYIEKDWGEAFPESWVWMQCADKESAFMCSIARIPLGIFSFTGLICVLLADGKQYRFATYNGGKLERLEMKKGSVTAEITKKNLRLAVNACNESFGSLKAPTKTGMDRVIAESIGAKYRISLFDNGNEIFLGSFDGGGLEANGARHLIIKRK